MYASKSSVLSTLPTWGKRQQNKYLEEAYISKFLRSQAPDSCIPSKNEPLFRALEIVRFATCTEEVTQLQRDIPSSNPHVVALFKDVVVEPFFFLAKETQNLHNTNFIYIDPSKTNLLRPMSADLFSVIPPSFDSQLAIKNSKHMHIKNGERFLNRMFPAVNY